MPKITPKNAKIFISYRRQDSAAVAGRLYDSLMHYFPTLHLFMDVASLDGGEDFSKKIVSSVESCDLFFCLIGPNWVDDGQGVNRMMDTEDFVRLEIETALQSGKTVIPILLEDTKMPDKELVPDSLKAVMSLNALELRQSRFGDDVAYIVKNTFGLSHLPDGQGFLIRLLKALAFGVPLGGVLVILLAQLSQWIVGEPLETIVGSDGVPVFIAGVPLLTVAGLFNFFRRR